MNQPTPASQGRVADVFKCAPFVRYMTGGGISLVGTWMQAMAQSWVMTTLTDKAMMLGMVSFATGAPMLLLSMAGGVAADRFDKRTILLWTQVLQIALALLVGWLIAAHRIQIWHILAVAAVLGVSNSFEMPASTALVPELVGRLNVAPAIAIDRAVFHGTRLIGPALAGYIIGKFGPAAAFYVNAFSFTAMIIALLSIHPRKEQSAEERQQRKGGIKEGIAYVRSDKPTVAMIGLMAATTFFIFPVFIVMMPLYTRFVLHKGAEQMGFLMGISGIGSLTGSIGLLAVPRHHRLLVLSLAAGAIALAVLGLSQATQVWMAGCCVILSSLGISSMIGLANTIVQERAPTPMRGRVSAVAGLSFFGLMPFAGLGITSLSDWIGIRPALLLASICYAVCAIYTLSGPGRQIKEIPPAAEPLAKAS